MSISGASVVAVADLLADVEHRRLVALALADDDAAADVQVAEGAAHRLGGGAVGAVAVAEADEAAATASAAASVTRTTSSARFLSTVHEGVRSTLDAAHGPPDGRPLRRSWMLGTL